MLRKLLQRISPSFASKVEAESKEWMMRCPKCGHERSVWDAGGIRYKATSPVYRLGKCPNCGRLGMLKVYR